MRSVDRVVYTCQTIYTWKIHVFYFDCDITKLFTAKTFMQWEKI